MTHEYAFDISLFSVIRVVAESEAEARAELLKHLDCAESNFGSWSNGDPILAMAGMDGEPELLEIDGEMVD